MHLFRAIIGRMIMDKLLTVVIPVFNDEKNIGRCLESLFNQTFDGMDIIVVNDASTDNTLDVIYDYQKKQPFQIIDLEENSGAGYCRNIGIITASTPFVTFVDSDDWVDMSTYESCFEQICNDTDVVNFGLIYDYVNQDRQERKYNYPTNYSMAGEFALSIYTHSIPNEIRITPIVNNKIYRRKFLIDNNILFHEELRYQEDDVFTFEVLARATRVAFVKNCYYHYCQRDDSLIQTVSEISIRSFISAYLVLKTNLESTNLFEKYRQAYYLKFKGSFLGVIKRILDYEPNMNNRNELLSLLLNLLIENYDLSEFLDTFNFSAIRSIL